MSYRQQRGSAGTRPYINVETGTVRAQVVYDYAAESSLQNIQAQREPLPAQFPQFNVRQRQNAGPRPPRQARGRAEYNTELQRARSRGQEFGFSRIRTTGRRRPFEHLGHGQSADDLIGILERYADQTYLARDVELSYVTAFLRQLDDLKDMIDNSWDGAELCADQDLSGHWAEFLNLFTAFLQGANDLYDGIQALMTRCERAMYDGRRRLRDDANKRFMRAFIDDRERADLTGDMRSWVRSITSLDGDPSSLLSQARDLHRNEELERQRRQGY